MKILFCILIFAAAFSAQFFACRVRKAAVRMIPAVAAAVVIAVSLLSIRSRGLFIALYSADGVPPVMVSLTVCLGCAAGWLVYLVKRSGNNVR